MGAKGQKKDRELTECEIVVMKSIWAAGRPVALPQIMESVNVERGKVKDNPWKPQTVSTFLTRLVKKEFLKMERNGRTFLYTPLVDEIEYGKMQVSKCAGLWYNNDASLFLSELNSRRKLTKDEIKRIRALIDSVEKTKA